MSEAEIIRESIRVSRRRPASCSWCSVLERAVDRPRRRGDACRLRGNAGRVPPVIVDTSALLAFFDASEPDHAAVSEVLAAADALVVSPYVVAELDYLVATRHGVDEELGVLDELTGGAWDFCQLSAKKSFAAPVRSSPATETRRSARWTHRSWCWLSGTGLVRSPAWTTGTSTSSAPLMAATSKFFRVRASSCRP